MKYKKFFVLAAVAMLLAAMCAGCGKGSDTMQDTVQTGSDVQNSANSDQTAATVPDKNTADSAASSAPQTDKTGSESTSEDTQAAADTFTFKTDVTDGITVSDNVYTITKAGEYSFIGTLDEGRIVVNAPDQEVVIALRGVTISSVKDSVIFVEKAEEVAIKAVEGTVNTLNDNRARRINDEDKAGSGCIYSKDDLNLQGKGTLIVNASYNNGIQSKNDIKIKNLTLSVTAPNTGIKGNDSVKIESGNITVTSSAGDGIKTKNTDISAKGKQRGNITIESGSVTVTAAKGCFDAAFELIIKEGPDTAVVQNKY